MRSLRAQNATCRSNCGSSTAGALFWRAATHWAWAEMMAGMGATYVPERWVEDGRFLTSAGGSAGIDMMLHLVDRLKG